MVYCAQSAKTLRMYHYKLTKKNSVMKNYPTILWANDALKKGSFSFVCDENLMRLRHELSDFCEEAYIEYAVLREKDGFRRCLREEGRFFSALAVIAENMPMLLMNDGLREFLGHMYQEPGVYFQGMVAVLQACGIRETYIAGFANLHIGEPEVRNWCKAHFGVCNADELFAAVKKEMPLPDMELVNLCRPRHGSWLFCLVFFVLGLFIGMTLLSGLLA